MIEIFSPEVWQIVALSVRVSVVAMLITLPVATAIAYLLATRRFPGWHLLNALCHLPLVMPPVITGYILLLAFSPKGWIGGPMKELFGFTFAFNWWGNQHRNNTHAN